jgi:hypothetical protein
MHVKGFLHKLLSPVTIHQKRLSTLSLAVEAVIRGKKLSLTALARSISLPIQERSAIKKIDRLLGNTKLHGERITIYKTCIHQVLGENKRPIIIIDWSQVPNTSFYVLRAAFVVQGRALTLYEEVHPISRLGNTKVQTTFLVNFKSALPHDVKPIILTDAGFYNEWFREVSNLQWDYIGRLRGNHSYTIDGENWLKCLGSFSSATNKAECLGSAMLCKKNTIRTYLYLIKDLPKINKYKNRNNKEIYKKLAKDPWLLASSLSKDIHYTENDVINLYRKRMQIEEGFRELKSSRYGLSFEHAYSKKIQRIEIFLLIAMLACLIAYITGIVAEHKKLHHQFQVNTLKRRVLSYFFLGCRVIGKKIKITQHELLEAVAWVQFHANEANYVSIP